MSSDKLFYYQQLLKIHQELEQLYIKKIKLVKAREEQLKKTIYQTLFGQPKLSIDAELESIDCQIDGLKKKSDLYLNILKIAAAAANTAKAKEIPYDWSKSLFFSKTLHELNFKYPPDQIGFYLVSMIGITIISKAYWKSWNITKGAEIIATNGNPEMMPFHRTFTKLRNEEFKEALGLRKIYKVTAFAKAAFYMGAYCFYVHFKNMHYTH